MKFNYLGVQQLNKHRVQLIDSLRGFSLLGILLANLLIFQYGLVGKDYIQNMSFIDQIGYYFTKIFIEYSAMPIFTFLFGYSLIKLVESIKRRKKHSRWVLIRRAIGLLVLGFIHSTYIWDGDILMFYGAMLFILLFFIYRQPKTLLIWAVICTIFIALFAQLFGLQIFDEDKIPAYVAQDITIMSTGTYTEIHAYINEADIPIDESRIGEIILTLLFTPLLNLPLFLLGMASAKRGMFKQLNEEQALYKKLSYVVIVGVMLKVVSIFDTPVQDVAISIGGPLLSIGYIALFAWLYTNAQAAQSTRIYTYFEAVGKLSLTNYLLQSVICTFIFYGYGFGLYSSFGVMAAIGLGLVIFSAQMLASKAYLSVCKRGPVEWLLRLWTNFSWK